MSWFQAFLVLTTVVVGASIAAQAAINAALARYVGTIEATLVSVTVTWVIVLLLMASGLRSGQLVQIKFVPVFLFVGGLFGVAVLITGIVVVPRLGTGVLIAGLLVGQLVGAILLDHWGIFGFRQIPISPTRVGGVLLLLLGMWLVLRPA